MADIKVSSAFVDEAVGNPAFVLKVVEPHSKKEPDGSYKTVSRTYYDLKASRDSGINLSDFVKGDRIAFSGSQRTEVREYEGKKYYTLTVWADQVRRADSARGGIDSQQAPVQNQPGSTGQQSGSVSSMFGDFNDPDGVPF